MGAVFIWPMMTGSGIMFEIVAGIGSRRAGLLALQRFPTALDCRPELVESPIAERIDGEDRFVESPRFFHLSLGPVNDLLDLGRHFVRLARDGCGSARNFGLRFGRFFFLCHFDLSFVLLMRGDSARARVSLKGRKLLLAVVLPVVLVVIGAIGFPKDILVGFECGLLINGAIDFGRAFNALHLAVDEVTLALLV